MQLRWLSALLCCAGFSLLASLAWAQEITLDAPASAPSGSDLRVQWTGPTEEQYHTIGVAKAGAPDSERLGAYSAFTYGKSPTSVPLPEEPGPYEIRFVAASSYQVLARRSLSITPVTATLDAPDSVVGGNNVSVTYTGPCNTYDGIGILPAGAPEKAHPGHYAVFTSNRSPVGVPAPEKPGQYEIRYLRGRSKTTLASRPLTVTAATASLQGPGTAVSGATIAVAVTGPHSEGDRIDVVPAGAPDNTHPGAYSSFTHGHAQVKVLIPEQTGQYEIRYLTGHEKTVLAREKLSIGGASAALQGPGKVRAGANFKVNWKGPDNQWDQIVIAPKGAAEDQWVGGGLVPKLSPATLRAPVTVGQYELRYQTGRSGATLARDELEVTPAQLEPGLLRVQAVDGTGQGALSAGGAVEVILDASGSMLQRIGSERRIDIAKQTLTQLTSSVIPAGTPFALRVFGREANSCQSDLDIPLRPLDTAAVAAKLAALEAKNNAKTPIGASLEKVAADLRGVKGERLVILVTDGEETCGGEPARAIEKLRKGGVNLRVNIVGFAVEDAKLAAIFRRWSIAGNGAYFDARDGASLKDALTSAIRPAYEVRDDQKKVVADGLTGGEPVPLLPGTYTVSLKGQKGSQRVTVHAKETASVQF